MADQNMTQTAGEKMELGFRSLLLSPVVEGNTLESEDVCSFLASRLSIAEGGSDLLPDSRNYTLHN